MCDDITDNDNDGLVDCDDSDCEDHPGCDGDDDDSAADDDDTMGDDDDTAVGPQVEYLQVHLNNETWDFAGYATRSAPPVATPTLAGSVPSILVSEMPGVVTTEPYLTNCTVDQTSICLLYTSPSPRDKRQARMPSSA